MSAVLGLLLSVVTIANLGITDGSGRITHIHHEHEAAPASHPHAVALLEQRRTSLLADPVSPLHSNSGMDACVRTCGNVTVPYPFGLSEGCARTHHFLLQCLNNSDSGYDLKPGPWPFLTTANGTFTPNYSRPHQSLVVNKFQVLDITPGFMIINTTTIKAGACRTSGFEWNNATTYGAATIRLPRGGPFRTSRNNVAFASGCYAQGYASALSNEPYDDEGYLVDATGVCGPTACYSSKGNLDPYAFCNDNDNDCSSCTLPFQSSLDVYLRGGGKCGFTSVLYPATFPPARGNVSKHINGGESYGLQLEWSLIVNEKHYPGDDCSTLEKNMPLSEYACSLSANCSYIRESMPTNKGPLNYTGYFCECTLAGYRGDGYKNSTGCKDINECLDSNPCNTEQGAKCTNYPGSYNCSCPGDLVGDGRRDGNGCKKSSMAVALKSSMAVALIAGLSACGVFVFVTLNGLAICCIYRKRQKGLQKTGTFGPADSSRRDFLLEIQSKEGANICRLFTYEELQKATDNFASNMELGSGGFGTVFEGTLNDGTKVAIKKAKHDVGGHNDTKQFINEVTVLSQVNHRNLVKLLGCCLETVVPVLVYEFISNGNLLEHLRRNPMHVPGDSDEVDGGPDNILCPNSTRLPFDWNNRLKVAIGTAEALTYLHSGTSPPIYHRDVKTANILLDKNYNAKVADFGLSKFVPLEATHLSTGIQGLGKIQPGVSVNWAASTKIKSANLGQEFQSSSGRPENKKELTIECALNNIAGTPGYLDPEYFDSFQITDKSDVYSFGVVLLEIITAEKPLDLSRQAGDHNLSLRCNRLMKHGRLEDIIDPILGASLDPKMLAIIHSVAMVAMKCVEKLRDDRPSMKEVLEELKSFTTPAKKDKSAFGKNVISKSRSNKRTFEEEIMAAPLLSLEGMSTNSEDSSYSGSNFPPTGRKSSLITAVSLSASNGSLFTSGSGDVSRSSSLELLPR